MSTWIVIGSANGSGNLGDEAMWHAAVRELRRAAGDVEIVTDSPDGSWGADGVPGVSELPYLYTTLQPFPAGERSRIAAVRLAAKILGRPIRWAAARRRYTRALRGPRGRLQQQWYDAIRTSSGVIVSGAGAITDRYAVNGVYAWSLLIHWARELGRPVAVLGQGVGPLSPRHIDVASAGLKAADFVGVRDERSADVARSWGVTEPVVQPDWATLAVPSDDDRRRAAALADDVGAPFLAVCVHTVNAESHDRDLRRALDSIGAFARERGLRVLLVPNMHGQGANSDQATMRRLLAGLSPERRTVFQTIDERLNARVTRALLSHAELVVASRYHSLVFAGAEGRWTVGLALDDYWSQKLLGAQRASGQPTHVVNVRDASGDLERHLTEALASAATQKLSGIDGSAAAEDLRRFVSAS